jgi:cytoskeletal protein CcmA (bactofilin family)
MLKKPPIETPPDKVNLVIGKDTYFKGSIKAKGLIRIDGEMEGEIDTQGDVIIGEGGRVNLDLKARHVAIAGRFEGNLEAVGKLEIRSSGIVVGSVKTNALVVDDGAILSGNLEMKEKDQQVKPLLKRVGAVDEASKDKNK